MKDFFIKYWSLLIIGSATIIFCLATIMQNIFNIELKDSLSIVIAFISIFATFGGAYLGAKMSGDNALKIANRDINSSLFKIQLYIERTENIYSNIKRQFDYGKDKNDIFNFQSFLEKADKDNNQYNEGLYKNLTTLVDNINLILEDKNFFYIANEVKTMVNLLELDDIKENLSDFIKDIDFYYQGGKIDPFRSNINNQIFNLKFEKLKKINKELEKIKL
ncbi:hypothetical protein [Staphylococcus hominis]